MSAVLYSLDIQRQQNIARACNRAKSKARALGYCRAVQIIMGNQVSDLMRDGLSEDEAIAQIVKPKSALHFDPPTRPAA